MIRRILMRNVSAWQIALYALASLAGLAIVMCAVQFYIDCRPMLAPGGDDQALRQAGYMVLTKPVGMLGGGDTRFTADEVADLKAQPWVEDAGEFTAAQFSVAARVDVGSEGMATMMFLESAPDQFLDVLPPGWDWSPASPYVPIVISADYLALYNFGFATSRGMRKLTPEMIAQVPVTLMLSGTGGAAEMAARVVGFSETLNTIAVPQGFMRWANARFAPGASAAPSRLIVQPTNLADPAIDEYLRSRGLETASPGAAASRMGQALRTVTGAVVAIGAVISLLALLVLVLSIHLLLQKNRDSIATLMLLGYSPWQIARCYAAMVSAVNAMVLAAAVAALAFASHAWRETLGSLAEGTPFGGIGAAASVGVCIMLAVTAYNIIALRRRVPRM